MPSRKRGSHKARLALEKRHWYTCDGRTLSWEDSWYTQPFYTASESHYDSAASTGPVNPPQSVLSTIAACKAQTTTTSGVTNRPSLTDSGTVSLSTTAPATVVSTAPPGPSSATGTSSSAVQTSSAAPSSSTTTFQSSGATTLASSGVSSSTAFPTVSFVTDATQQSSTTSLAAVNFHAGTWDLQAQGAAFAGAVALLAGSLVWGLWAVLRPRFPVLYAPRKWFLLPGSGPSPPTLGAFFTPFLHLQSLASPTSDAHVTPRVTLAVLVMSTLATVLSLGIFLPLMVAGVPHLDATSPANSYGGHLGSLTDLSLLRLLNALDPSPDSPSTRALLHHHIRNLPSTITPAIGTARARLIAVLVLTATVWVGGSLFVISLVYRDLVKYGDRFDDACEGQDMVFVPSEGSSWRGMTETGIRRRLVKVLCPEDECSVEGVFVVNHLLAVNELVRERTHVLDVLETAEAKYILSFPPLPPHVPRNMGDTTASTAGTAVGTLSTAMSSTSEPNVANFTPAGPKGSAFLEVAQRRSVIDNNGRLHIGQKVLQDSDGTFLPAPGGSSPAGSRRVSIAPSLPSPAHSDRTSVHTSASVSRPTSLLLPRELAKLKADVTWTRSRLQKLNARTEAAQKKKLQSLTRGDETAIGWIIVGRGVRTLPNALEIRGRSKEDIIWDNLGATGSLRTFWYKVAGITAVLLAISLPFIGLAIASAPGVSHYLGFLKPLSNTNGIGAGVVEGFVPAVVLTVAFLASAALVKRFVTQLRPVSHSECGALASKASFYVLLAVGTLWVVTVAAVEFGVQGFATNVQQARAVGDGAVFISWLSLITVVNLALVVPGLMVLRPVRFVQWLLKKRKAITPRQRFLLACPPDFDPTVTVAPLLAAFFQLSALGGVFPLLVIPTLIFAYLTLVSSCWLATRVFCLSHGGPSDGSMARWAVRRLGWAVGLQPAIFGLVLLSRNEWIIGGVGVGIGAFAPVVSELVTVVLHRPQKQPRFPLADFSRTPPADESKHRRFGSDHSMLATLHDLLPGLSRLPNDNPLPFATDAINDLQCTRRATYASPQATKTNKNMPCGPSIQVINPADESRGLIYAPDLLAPIPDVWLPRDPAGVAQHEADNLAGEGLMAVIDPVEFSDYQ